MKEITKYVSDVCGIDIIFPDRISCACFERKIKDLNTYIGFGKKYDELVDGLEHSQYSSMRAGFVDEFLKGFKNYELDCFTPAFVKVVQFMLKFAKDNEKVLRKYLDNKLQYVEATYSSSHDCHDEIESYAFPAEYTEEEILDYIGDCARSWYESMGYAEEAEDEDVEDEGPDYSFAVIPIEEIRKHNDWTSYSII